MTRTSSAVVPATEGGEGGAELEEGGSGSNDNAVEAEEGTAAASDPVGDDSDQELEELESWWMGHTTLCPPCCRRQTRHRQSLSPSCRAFAALAAAAALAIALSYFIIVEVSWIHPFNRDTVTFW